MDGALFLTYVVNVCIPEPAGLSMARTTDTDIETSRWRHICGRGTERENVSANVMRTLYLTFVTQ
jgi:hypothetical protein